MENYELHKLKSTDVIPFNLLLLADETQDAIEKYIYHSDVYIVLSNTNINPVAAFGLYKINDLVIEIKNIAVTESHQGKGIGSFLIAQIKDIAGKQHYKEIIVGTPDSAKKQIHFYEKNGFAKYDIKKDFFIENYPEPIIENGNVLRDMIMLKALIS